MQGYVLVLGLGSAGMPLFKRMEGGESKERFSCIFCIFSVYSFFLQCLPLKQWEGHAPRCAIGSLSYTRGRPLALGVKGAGRFLI